ncbi:MAG TPA: Ldh family oxidoreductase [Alphaproteobacteria bacterium]|nr:Ldh family oxidoreductase [Alphaproteobacteria bacterium]
MESVLICEAALKRFCAAVLQTVNVPADQAVAIIDNLVEADLRGVDSHGVVRLPIYVKRLAVGAMNPRPQVKIVRETRTSAVVDGDNGMGQWVGQRAMEIAIDKAKDGDCVFVSVCNSNHFGAAAWYAQLAAAHDMIGLAFTIGGINHMTPWGGAEAILGNNPFAIAFPAGAERPVVLDMACSVAARGKIIVAAKEGRPIPADWAVGPDGAPTTDAAEALKGFVSPVGGPKGYALTLSIGLLSTMLSGAFFGSEVTHMYDDLENPQNIGHLFGVLPVAAFEDVATYKARMDKAVREVRGVKRAPGVARIYLPGEREYLLLEERRKTGIPIGTGVFGELQALGREYGIELKA